MSSGANKNNSNNTIAYVPYFLDPRLQAVGEKRLGSMKEWFDKRLDEAYNAAEERENEKNSKCTTIIIKCIWRSEQCACADCTGRSVLHAY